MKMKPKLKVNTKFLKKNLPQDSNKKKKFKNTPSLNHFKTNYLPEFTSNKTIKKYISSKLKINDTIAENTLYNNKTIKNHKNRMMTSLSKEKKHKSQSYLNKNLHFYETIPKNGGNYEELNNHNSISHTEIHNGNLNLIHYSYRDLNPTINITSNGTINNSKKKYITNSNSKAHKNMVIQSKKNLMNKINSNVNKKILKNLTNQNIFNKDYYNFENYNNYNKSSNNLFEKNKVQSRIKNLKQNKIRKKEISLNDNFLFPKDNLNNKNLYKNKNKHNKVININKKQNSKIFLKTNNKQSKTIKSQKFLINQKIENGLNEKKETNIINYIIQNIFKNADIAEKKLNKKKKETESRLYSPLLNKYKNGVMINNNTSIIKCGYTNKEKFYFEYQNQIKRK